MIPRGYRSQCYVILVFGYRLVLLQITSISCTCHNFSQTRTDFDSFLCFEVLTAFAQKTRGVRLLEKRIYCWLRILIPSALFFFSLFCYDHAILYLSFESLKWQFAILPKVSAVVFIYSNYHWQGATPKCGVVVFFVGNRCSIPDRLITTRLTISYIYFFFNTSAAIEIVTTTLIFKLSQSTLLIFERFVGVPFAWQKQLYHLWIKQAKNTQIQVN